MDASKQNRLRLPLCDEESLTGAQTKYSLPPVVCAAKTSGTNAGYLLVKQTLSMHNTTFTVKVGYNLGFPTLAAQEGKLVIGIISVLQRTPPHTSVALALNSGCVFELSHADTFVKPRKTNRTLFFLLDVIIMAPCDG